MLLDQFDEIQSAGDAELLRLYRQTLLRNTNGRLDNRLQRIIAEIRRRNAYNLIQGDAYVRIETQLNQ